MTRRASWTAVLALAILPGIALWRPAEAKADPAPLAAPQWRRLLPASPLPEA